MTVGVRRHRIPGCGVQIEESWWEAPPRMEREVIVRVQKKIYTEPVVLYKIHKISIQSHLPGTSPNYPGGKGTYDTMDWRYL